MASSPEQGKYDPRIAEGKAYLHLENSTYAIYCHPYEIFVLGIVLVDHVNQCLHAATAYEHLKL